MLTKIRQLIQVFSGTSLIGIGISLNYLANLGLGPWGVFHDGLSKTLGISYGKTIIITGVAVMLLWIPLKQKPGIGTIIDIFLVGIVADLIILNFKLSDSIILSLALITFGIILIGAAGNDYHKNDVTTGDDYDNYFVSTLFGNRYYHRGSTPSASSTSNSSYL